MARALRMRRFMAWCLPTRGAVLLLALGLSGCVVRTRHLADAVPVFAKARAEAARAQGEPGGPGRLNVLVFEPDDGELTEIKLPMWLWRKFAKEADVGDEAIAAALKPEALDRAGRGLLLEVEDEDGGQVLVWLR